MSYPKSFNNVPLGKSFYTNTTVSLINGHQVSKTDYMNESVMLGSVTLDAINPISKDQTYTSGTDVLYIERIIFTPATPMAPGQVFCAGTADPNGPNPAAFARQIATWD